MTKFSFTILFSLFSFYLQAQNGGAVNGRIVDTGNEPLSSISGMDSVQQLPLNFLGITLQADEDTNNLIFDKYYDTLYTGYNAQLQVHKSSGLLSPFMPARLFSTYLAGTALTNSLHFYSATAGYRKDFIRILNNRLRDKSLYGGRDTGKVEFWKTLPVFQYQQTATSRLQNSSSCRSLFTSPLLINKKWLD